MTRRIVIVGAGGFGRGVYSWLMASQRHRDAHGVTDVVFIDDDQKPRLAPQAEIVSTIHEYRPAADDELLCALGVPVMRRRVVKELDQRGAKFHSFVDDRAVIGSGVQIGDGAVICPGVVISADAVIGDHVHINFNCSVGHDTVLGEFTTLSPSVNVMGGVQVRESVFLGGSAVVLPRIGIGTGATVGAGAVVVKSVEAGTTVVGNPARPAVGAGDPS